MPLQGAVDPDALVLQELAHTAGALAWLRQRVGELDADALVWGVTQEDDRQSGVGRAGTDVRREARPHPYVALLGEWSDRLTKQAETAVRMGIERRQVELAEALGGQLAEVLAAVLDELDLSAAQRLRAREVVPARLRAITGGMA